MTSVLSDGVDLQNPSFYAYLKLVEKLASAKYSKCKHFNLITFTKFFQHKKNISIAKLPEATNRTRPVHLGNEI